MAKRFTDTDKYRKPFLRGLQGAYKLLWDYICNECDHAGIWVADFEIAQICLGADMPINKNDALNFFNADKVRVVEICGGTRWFVKSFIDFQYGDLDPRNRVHMSAIKTLKSFDLWNDESGEIKPLTSPLQGAKYKDKYKDKNKDKDEGGSGETSAEPEIIEAEVIDPTSFESVWEMYGKKGNKKTSSERWGKLSAKAKNLALEHIPKYVESTPDPVYRKNFEVYISKEGWNDEIITSNGKRTNTGAVNSEDEEFFRGIAEGIQRGQNNRLRERSGG